MQEHLSDSRRTSRDDRPEANEAFEALLARAAREHGHLCPGQVLGVRLALLGCRLVGVDPGEGRKPLVVFVEIDRCATDAIQTVTGCRLGKRTLKHVDYGKMAATFLNTATGAAYRVAARESSRVRAWAYAPAATDKRAAQLAAYRAMPDAELFAGAPVAVALRPEDAPGHPTRRVYCVRCGERVNDGREVLRDGAALCRACAGGAYYARLGPGAVAPHGPGAAASGAG